MISVTVDNVVFSAQETDQGKALFVLLVERKFDPFQGKLALPGGFVEEDETLVDAATRELLEETGIIAVPFGRLDIRTAVDRDPRGRVIAFPFLYAIPGCPEPKAGDDAAHARWHDLNDFATGNQDDLLAFDHLEILQDGLGQVLDIADEIAVRHLDPAFVAVEALRESIEG